MDNPVYHNNFGTPIVMNQDNNDLERDFQNPLYSDVGPSSEAKSTSNPTHDDTCRVEGQEELYTPANYEVPCNSIPGTDIIIYSIIDIIYREG